MLEQCPPTRQQRDLLCKSKVTKRRDRIFVLPACSKRSSRKIIPKKEIYSPIRSSEHSFYQTSFTSRRAKTVVQETRIVHEDVINETSPRQTTKRKVSQVIASEFHKWETLRKSQFSLLHTYKSSEREASKNSCTDSFQFDMLRSKIRKIIYSDEACHHRYSALTDTFLAKSSKLKNSTLRHGKETPDPRLNQIENDPASSQKASYITKVCSIKRTIQKEKDRIAAICSNREIRTSIVPEFGKPVACEVCQAPTDCLASSKFDRAGCKACLRFFADFLHQRSPSTALCPKQGRCGLSCRACCWLKSCLQCFPISQWQLANLPQPLPADAINLDYLKATIASILDEGVRCPSPAVLSGESSPPVVCCAICTKSNEFLECGQCHSSFHLSCLPADSLEVCPNCNKRTSSPQSSSDSGLGHWEDSCCPLCGQTFLIGPEAEFCSQCRSWAHTSCINIKDLLPQVTLFCHCRPPAELLYLLRQLILFKGESIGRTQVEHIAAVESKLESGAYTAVWEVCRDMERLAPAVTPNGKWPLTRNPVIQQLRRSDNPVKLHCARTLPLTPPFCSKPKEGSLAEPELPHLITVELPIALRMRLLQSSCKTSLSVHRSSIHGMGLFSRTVLSSGDLIIEYSGELIRSVVADRRERDYQERGLGCYMFRVDEEWVVDATLCGNAARYINHSCDPNCYSEVFLVDGTKHILILALKQIPAGEELTYDYKFPEEETGKLPCNCAAASCRQYLN